MATDAENLLARRSTILEELASMTSTSVGGKPNSSGGGDSVRIDHVGYRKSLYDELKMINETLGQIQGSVEVHTYGDI